ncbi:MAG: family 1 glycosylhydrolase [Bacillota bacterium]
MGEALRFPPGFLWGTATSSHQVEGGNVNDWSEWEQRPGRVWGGHRSGRACDQFHLYPRDFAQLGELGFTAHRFSLEWSRIEPEEGRFSQEAVDHYRRVVDACRESGMEPFVTLHHFTNPLWLSRRGGWLNRRVVDWFARYTEVAVRAVGDRVTWWLTLNEPLVFATMGYLTGIWPPGHRRFGEAVTVVRHMLMAHARAYRVIKEHFPATQVGVAHHLRPFHPLRPRSLMDRWLAAFLDHVFNRLFVEAVETGHAGWPVWGWLSPGKRGVAGLAGSQDFLGLNYYSRGLVRFAVNLAAAATQPPPAGAEVNQLGWEVYPEGLLEVLRSLGSHGKPIVITENGICTDDDGQRVRFIQRHLEVVHRAIREGIRVVGYFYWSSHDNFEWAEGYRARFGLIGVNFETQERTARPSGRFLGQVARTGVLPPLDTLSG